MSEENKVILAFLERIEEKADKAAVNAALAAQHASILNSKMDDHIAQDRITHQQIDSRLTPLEHLRTKIVMVCAFFGVVGGVLLGFAKDAIANVFFNH